MSVERVLAVARREIGTVESPPNSNKQKYGKAYGWDGVAWCAIFVWWVFAQAGCGALIPKTASTVVMRDWYRKRGEWHTSDPKPGDLVFFKFAGNSNPVNHVGLVEVVERGSLITIEGNTTGTSAGDQRNGGMVARRRRASNIVGYARPAYSEEDELSQAQVDQIINQLRRDIGFARDQIMSHLGKRPDMAPLPPAHLPGVEVARRVDVGYARDQLMAECAEIKHEQDQQRKDIDALFDLVEAIAKQVGVPLKDTPGEQ